MQIEEKTLIKEEALLEEKALNAERHEDILNAVISLIAKLFIPPSWNNFYSLFCPLFSPLFFLELIPKNCFALSGCAVWLTTVYVNLGWLCSRAMPLLVFAVTCLCVTGMANIVNVPYTWVYRRLFSSITHVTMIANTLIFYVWRVHPFLMMPKRERWHDLVWFSLRSVKLT